MVDVRKNGIRLFSGCFSSETNAAVYYDLKVIEIGLNRPTNFTEVERNILLNSREWKEEKFFGSKKTNFKSSSSYFGVIRFRKYWRAQINQTYIGNFSNEVDAALAYNDYVLQNNLPYKLNKLGEL